MKQKRRVKVVTSVEEKKRISCDSPPHRTSGHFRMTMTWRRVAKRFHWKGLASDVRTMVSLNSGSRVNLVRCMLAIVISQLGLEGLSPSTIKSYLAACHQKLAY